MEEKTENINEESNVNDKLTAGGALTQSMSSQKSQSATQSSSQLEGPSYAEYKQREQTAIDRANEAFNEAEIKEAKRHAKRQLIRALGDGISAIASAYYTYKGAPNMLQKQTLTGQAQERYDKAKADRQARQDAYLKKISDDIWSEAKWNRESIKNNLEQRRKERETAIKESELTIKQAKEDRDAEIYKIESKIKTNNLSEAEAKKRIAEINAEYQERIHQATLRQKNASAAASHAAAVKNRSQAEQSNNEEYETVKEYVYDNERTNIYGGPVKTGEKSYRQKRQAEETSQTPNQADGENQQQLQSWQTYTYETWFPIVNRNNIDW